MHRSLLNVACILLHPLSCRRRALLRPITLTLLCRAAFGHCLILFSYVLREVLDPLCLLTFSLHHSMHR